MRPTFVFMATRDDRTAPNALALVQSALSVGVRNVGFKDVGLPAAALVELAAAIRAGGGTVHLEIVSLDEAAEASSAKAAVALGADVLMGGTRPRTVLPLIAGTSVRYLPFAGDVDGHPSRLLGNADDIARSADALAAIDGVAGVDLLAWRSKLDAGDLIRRVVRAARGKEVYVAGSIRCASQIRTLTESGAAGFTIGSAALDDGLPAAPGLDNQLRWVEEVRAARLATGEAFMNASLGD